MQGKNFVHIKYKQIIPAEWLITVIKYLFWNKNRLFSELKVDRNICTSIYCNVLIQIFTFFTVFLLLQYNTPHDLRYIPFNLLLKYGRMPYWFLHLFDSKTLEAFVFFILRTDSIYRSCYCNKTLTTKLQ